MKRSLLRLWPGKNLTPVVWTQYGRRKMTTATSVARCAVRSTPGCVLLLLTCSCVCAQGSKRAQQALEKAEARAAKKAAKTDERDPKLPTSVLLPKDVSEVNNVHVATLLAEGVAAAAAGAATAEPAHSPH